MAHGGLTDGVLERLELLPIIKALKWGTFLKTLVMRHYESLPVASFWAQHATSALRYRLYEPLYLMPDKWVDGGSIPIRFTLVESPYDDEEDEEDEDVLYGARMAFNFIAEALLANGVHLKELRTHGKGKIPDHVDYHNMIVALQNHMLDQDVSDLDVSLRHLHARNNRG